MGMWDDPHTCYAYPTSSNICTYCQPFASPLLEYQSVYCLSRDYKTCPAYQQPPDQALPLPQETRKRLKKLHIPQLLASALRRLFPRGQ